MAGDSVFRKAVAELVDTVPVAELADDTIDAMIFKIEPDNPAALPVLVEPLLPQPDPLQRHLWWLALGMALFWLCAGGVVFLALFIRWVVG